MTAGAKSICEKQLVEQDKEHLRTVALRAYSSNQKKLLDEEQITELLPMVHKIARRTVTYLKPPLSFEDLISAGTVGLIKAARDFDPSHQAEFETYAYIKIKGAILDELRGACLLSSSRNKQVQNAIGVSRKIVEQTGKPPSDDELAQELGISLDKLYKTFETARAMHFVSIDAFCEDCPALGNILASANTTTPDKQLEQAELINRVTEAIQQLPDRQRRIILLYYQQYLTMRQIAQVFKVTESRISQLHAGALFNLSIKLRQWKDGGQ